MITAWILMTYVSYHSGLQYSPPVATEASCEAMKQKALQKSGGYNIISCVKVEIYK